MAKNSDFEGCEDDTIFEYFSDNDRDPMECNDDDQISCHLQLSKSGMLIEHKQL